ncbi:MAG: 5-formyltetrahydrofolate cyclo-ligase [Candidatus Margulisiibacteriota bacterium]|jgi:5-formyltetrahydrofolate cyclo-ligase
MGIAKNSSDLDIFQQKKSLRKEFLEKRLALSLDAISIASSKAVKALNALPFFDNLQKIAGYSAFKNEIDLTNFYLTHLKNPKEIFVPKFDVNLNSYSFASIRDVPLIVGKYQVLEPFGDSSIINIEQAANLIDVWLVPGLAFSRLGFRLGFGKGYYDTFLKAAKGIKIGVGYTWQLLDELPITDNDIALDYLVLEENVIRIT